MQQTNRISGDGASYVGKRLIVGITVNGTDGEFLYQEQFHGLIVSADDKGIVIERSDNGARVTLPPELQKAPPGEYRFRSTGEVVVDPAYLAKWVWTEGDADRKSSGSDSSENT